MSTAFLYPGQGSQRVGMLGALPDSAATRQTLSEATDVLGDISALDSAEALGSTTNDQLALLISAVAATRILGDQYGVTPSMVAGHSAGAFGAAVAAALLGVRFAGADGRPARRPRSAAGVREQP